LAIALNERAVDFGLMRILRCHPGGQQRKD
jgi:hypothetical protein